MIKTFYLATKMRGVPLYNYPLFDAVRDCLVAMGYQVVSPADLDRAKGFDPSLPQSDLTQEMVREFFADSIFHLIMQADAVLLLPGWKKSRGAMAEVYAAKAIDLPLFVWENGEIWPCVEDQADGELMNEVVQITTHDRQSQYGSPNKDFEKIARMWSAIFEHEFKPTDVALALVCLKISRLSHAVKVDSLRDLGGYARCAYQIFMEEERGRLGGPITAARAEAITEEVPGQSGSAVALEGDQTDPYPLCGHGIDVSLADCGAHWPACQDSRTSSE